MRKKQVNEQRTASAKKSMIAMSPAYSGEKQQKQTRRTSQRKTRKIAISSDDIICISDEEQKEESSEESEEYSSKNESEEPAIRPIKKEKMSSIKKGKFETPTSTKSEKAVFEYFDVAMIEESRRKGKETEYYVMKANEQRQWIPEEHAKFICPNKLKAFKSGDISEMVDEDRELMSQRKKMWEKFSKTGQISLEQPESTQIKGKKSKKGGDEGAGGLTAGCNDEVLGKKRNKKQQYKKDYYNDEISDDDNKKYFSRRKDVKSNQKSKNMISEFKNAKSPKPNSYKGKYTISDSSIFDEPYRVAKCVKSMRHQKNGKGIPDHFVTVEWLQMDGHSFEPSYILYEDARARIPKLLCDLYIRNLKLTPYSPEEAMKRRAQE